MGVWKAIWYIRMKMGTHYQAKKSAQKVLEEHGMKQKSATSRPQSAQGDWGVCKLSEEDWKVGVGSGVWNQIEEPLSRQRSTNGNWEVLSQQRSAKQGEVRSMEWYIGVIIQTVEHRWELRSSHPRLRSAEWNTGVPIKSEGIEKWLSQWRSAERGGIDCGIK